MQNLDFVGIQAQMAVQTLSFRAAISFRSQHHHMFQWGVHQGPILQQRPAWANQPIQPELWTHDSGTEQPTWLFHSNPLESACGAITGKSGCVAFGFSVCNVGPSNSAVVRNSNVEQSWSDSWRMRFATMICSCNGTMICPCNGACHI